jgi:hypothetical protein
VKPRRVVVAESNGISTVIEDGVAPRTDTASLTPGYAQSVVWMTRPQPTLRADADPTVDAASLLPPVGGTTLILMKIVPDSVYTDPSYDPIAAGAEIAGFCPGLAETFEVDAPGFHTTSTVDYDVVLDGEVWLQLSDSEVHLSAGDVVAHDTPGATSPTGPRPCSPSSSEPTSTAATPPNRRATNPPSAPTRDPPQALDPTGIRDPRSRMPIRACPPPDRTPRPTRPFPPLGRIRHRRTTIITFGSSKETTCHTTYSDTS